MKTKEEVNYNMQERSELQDYEAGDLWQKALKFSLSQELAYRINADNGETFVLDIDVDDNNYKISYKIQSEDFKILHYGAESNINHAAAFNVLVASTLAYLIDVFYPKEEMTTLEPNIYKLTSVKEAENSVNTRPKIEIDFNNGEIFKVNPDLKDEVLKLIEEHNVAVNQQKNEYQRLKTPNNFKHSTN